MKALTARACLAAA